MEVKNEIKEKQEKNPEIQIPSEKEKNIKDLVSPMAFLALLHKISSNT